MKRILGSLILALALVAPALPANAGWYYWEPSPCRADVEWFRSDAGVWYWLDGWSETHGAHLVPNGYYLDIYAGYGYECGFLGAALTNKICQPGFCYEQFEGGVISSRT
jgi:hypothetical protein